MATRLEASIRTVGDVMTREVLSVPDTMTARELALFLAENEISGAPVVDHEGRPVGVVSTFDLAKLAAEEVDWSGEARAAYYRTTPLDDEVVWELYGSDSLGEAVEPEGGETLVRDFMTPVVQAVSPEMTVTEVARIMVAGHYHRLLVRKDEELVGIVTSMDLLGILAEA